MPTLHIQAGDGTETILSAPAGANLLEVLRGHPAGHPPTPCGGHGTCHKCRVRLTAGFLFCPPTGADRAAFSSEALNAGWRLACRATLPAGAEIWLEQTGHQTAEACEAGICGREPTLAHTFALHPLTLPEPSLDDTRPEEERLQAALSAVCGEAAEIPLLLLQKLPNLLQAGRYSLEALTNDRKLVALRPAGFPLLGAAVDLGTTTVALALYDLHTGALLTIVAAGNRQAEYGDDVISRITAAGTPGGLEKLQAAAQETIRGLLLEACRSVNVSSAGLVCLTVAGNTVMQHLLTGVSPAGIGVSPFTPIFTSGQNLTLSDIMPFPAGLPQEQCWPGNAPAYLLPCLGPYVGGDLTAGVLSQHLPSLPGHHLLIDAGTNGEIVLQSAGRTLACSTAAGPAFEGARISCGMRACGGAVSALTFTTPQKGRLQSVHTDFAVQTIGNEKPLGLCGSGLLDAIACLLEANLIDETGALTDPDDLPGGYPPLLRRRLLEDGVHLADEVVLTQKDIREFQLACAAMQAGAQVLLAEAGIRAEDLDQVLLAGGFGSRLSVSSALRTGLIPYGVSAIRVHAIGNASLAGARLCLLDFSAREEAETLRQNVRCLELSSRKDFQKYYMDAMDFSLPLSGVTISTDRQIV